MATNVFELFAKLGMDSSEFDKGLSEAGEKAKKSVGTIAKVLAGAVGAGATAIVALTKQAVSAYADYEQNVGGIQKLYGNMGMSLEQYASSVGKSTDEVAEKWQKLEDAQNLVLKNAQNAYRTAGMSANQYMETATQFSASLISSLGGDMQKSAEMTDIAMTAISDNWNTFGGDLESITNAYKGFSKQNYTMLDNLKLGYGGTKEEMERLIADANKLGDAYGVTSKLSIDSFADIITAIQAVQKYQNIAGTTAREASTTVSGSLNMAKMAWENLVTGFGNDSADLNQLIKNLVESVVGYTDEAGEHVNGVVDNLLPVIITAVTSIATAIDTVIPIISEKLPSLVEELLPTIISGATNLVAGLLSALPEVLTVLVNSIPLILSTLMTATDWSGIGTALLDSLTSVFDMAISGLNSLIMMDFPQIGSDTISNIVNGIVSVGGNLLSSFGNLMAKAIEALLSFMPTFLATSIEFVAQMAVGIANNLPQFISSLIDLVSQGIQTLMQNLPQFLSKGGEIVGKMADGIIKNIPNIVMAILKGIVQLIDTITSNLPEFLSKGGEIIGKLITGILGKIWDLAGASAEISATVLGELGKLPEKAWKWGTDLIDSFVQGIKSMLGSVGNAVKGVADKVANFLHFSEPDEGPLSNFHTYAPDMMKLFAQGIKQNSGLLEEAFNESLDFAEKGIQTEIDYEGKVVGIKSDKSKETGNYEVVINVYASEGMNVKDLADEVAKRLQKLKDRGEKVFE